MNLYDAFVEQLVQHAYYLSSEFCFAKSFLVSKKLQSPCLTYDELLKIVTILLLLEAIEIPDLF